MMDTIITMAELPRHVCIPFNAAILGTREAEKLLNHWSVLDVSYEDLVMLSQKLAKNPLDSSLSRFFQGEGSRRVLVVAGITDEKPDDKGDYSCSLLEYKASGRQRLMSTTHQLIRETDGPYVVLCKLPR